MSDTVKAILETQLIGACRVAATMPLEHALDRLKTYKQSRMDSTYMESLKELIGTRGIRGLYDGFQPSFIRGVIKQYYRWPMMIMIPKFLNEHVSNEVANKVLTGFFIGLFESCIICPLERLKTLKMTTVATNFGYFQQITLKSVYTGLQVQTARQVISWTSYLYWDHKIRYYLKKDRHEGVSLMNTFVAAAVTSVLNIALVHPFDTIKTLFQMENNHAYRNLSVRSAFVEVYLNYGLSGLYAGWQARVIAYFCQALLTTPTIDYLERTYGIAKQ